MFFFFLFPPGDLLIILYQLTKFETYTYNTYADITIINFQSPNLQREINRKKNNVFTRQSTYIILYQLTKFEAPSYNQVFKLS